MTDPDPNASDDLARLRRHFADPGAFATASPLGEGVLALYRGRGGVTLGAGTAALADAEMLVASGEALWQGAGGRRRLVGRKTGPLREPATAEAESGLDERESPLLWLHRRAGKDGARQIADVEFAAGERFRADLTRAGLLPQVTSNWDALAGPAGRGGGRDPAAASDAVIAARQRVRRACSSLGADLSGLAIDVCGFLKRLDLVERERGWPRRSGKVVMRLALARLAEHYGLSGEAHGPARAASRAWREEGARPTVVGL